MRREGLTMAAAATSEGRGRNWQEGDMQHPGLVQLAGLDSGALRRSVRDEINTFPPSPPSASPARVVAWSGGESTKTGATLSALPLGATRLIVVGRVWTPRRIKPIRATYLCDKLRERSGEQAPQTAANAERNDQRSVTWQLRTTTGDGHSITSWLARLCGWPMAAALWGMPSDHLSLEVRRWRCRVKYDGAVSSVFGCSVDELRASDKAMQWV